MCGFQFLKGPMILDPSGQLAKLIVYITSTRVDLYSHQILLRREPTVFNGRFSSETTSYAESVSIV